MQWRSWLQGACIPFANQFVATFPSTNEETHQICSEKSMRPFREGQAFFEKSDAKA
jgi:hypothetical protein